MEAFSEDLIWDSIKDHAKGRIDYPAFASFFTMDPDNFLSSTIYGFAVGQDAEAITNKIVAQVYMTGNFLNRPALRAFIEDNQSALQAEIALTRRVLHLLNDGEEPEEIYSMVLASLNDSIS